MGQEHPMSHLLLPFQQHRVKQLSESCVSCEQFCLCLKVLGPVSPMTVKFNRLLY